MTHVTHQRLGQAPDHDDSSGGGELPRRFLLRRFQDVSGVSGVGRVAYGTTYPTGTTTLVWCAGDVTSVTVYGAPEDVVAIHGHDGGTRLVWIDTPPDNSAASGTVRRDGHGG